MKGGFNNPPNGGDVAAGLNQIAASMKGGFNNPPNAPVLVPEPEQPVLQ